eukprot:1158067-Pelagomonas_calceolata.AAC.11
MNAHNVDAVTMLKGNPKRCCHTIAQAVSTTCGAHRRRCPAPSQTEHNFGHHPMLRCRPEVAFAQPGCQDGEHGCTQSTGSCEYPSA